MPRPCGIRRSRQPRFLATRIDTQKTFPMTLWKNSRTADHGHRLHRSVNAWFCNSSNSSITPGLAFNQLSAPLGSDQVPINSPVTSPSRQTQVVAEFDPKRSIVADSTNAEPRSAPSRSGFNPSTTSANSFPASRSPAQVRRSSSWTHLMRNTQQTMAHRNLDQLNRPLVGPRRHLDPQGTNAQNDSSRPFYATQAQPPLHLGSYRPPSPFSDLIGRPDVTRATAMSEHLPAQPASVRQHASSSKPYSVTLQHSVHMNRSPQPSSKVAFPTIESSVAPGSQELESEVAPVSPEHRNSPAESMQRLWRPAPRPITPFLPVAPTESLSNTSSDLDKKKEARTSSRATPMLPPIR